MLQKGHISFCSIGTVMLKEDNQVIIAHYLVLGEDAPRVLYPFEEEEDKLEGIQRRYTRANRGWKNITSERMF